MIIVYGRRMCGEVESSGPTSIRTQFVHIYYMPLFPIASHLVVGQGQGNSLRTLSIPMHGVSVLAAYLRSWGIAGALGCIVSAAVSDSVLEAVPWLVFAAILGGAAVWSWTSLGRPSRETLAQREAYSRFIGLPLDVALVRSKLADSYTKLRQNVEARAHELLGGSYRTTQDPKTQWDVIALDPTVIDRSFVEACLTLARFEWADALGADKERYARSHRDLWSKLKTLPSEPPALRA